MSEQIAQMSSDFVRDLGLLSGKTLVDESLDTALTASDQSTLQQAPPSNVDSLDTNVSTDNNSFPARDGLLLDDEDFVSSDRVPPRKTWNSRANGNALDGLMLSNVCALSSRLCAIADGLTGKIALLHARSAAYDTNQSQIPML